MVQPAAKLVEVYSPITRATLSLDSDSKALTAPVGETPPVSLVTSWTCRPPMPPLPLITETAYLAMASSEVPSLGELPVSGAARPMRIGEPFAADEPPDEPADGGEDEADELHAAAPASAARPIASGTRRRCLFLMMAFPSLVPSSGNRWR